MAQQQSNYPQPGFHFNVSFLFEEGDKNKYLSSEDAKFTEVSGIGSSLAFEGKGGFNELGRNTNPIHFPVRHSFTDLVLKRGFVTSNKLIKWFEESLFGLTIKPVGMLVSLLDTTHKPLMNWQFYDAYPVEWTVDGFNAMESKLLIETIKLKYSYFKLVKP